jgi:hypothetical protein
LGYAKRGATILRDYGIVGYDKFSLNYLDLSLLLNLWPCKFFGINGGFGFGYLMGAKGYWGKDRSAATTEHYNRFDLGVKAGATLSIKNITLNLSYTHSLNKLRSIYLKLPIPGAPDEGETSYYNRSLEFSIGYQFEILKKAEKAKRID